MAYPETMSELTNYPKALSHAGAGGGNVEIKTLYIENPNTTGFYVQGAIVNGKYGVASLAAKATTAIQYIEPVEGRAWAFEYSGVWEFSTDYELPEQVNADGPNLSIYAGLPDGTTVHLKAKGGQN